VHVIASRVSEEVRVLPVAWQERAFTPGDVAGFRLVTAATDDPAVNRAVFEDGERHSIWVNAADEPDSCSFTLPAVVRRGALTVAISTGGHSPALATWLKNRIDSEIGMEYETLLGLLAQLRSEIKASGQSTEHLAWQTAIDNDVLEMIRNDRIAEAAAVLRQVVLPCCSPAG